MGCEDCDDASAALLRCSPWLTAYGLRLIRNDVAKARLLRVTLSGRSTAEMQDWTERWLANDFPGQLQDWTMARLAWHRRLPDAEPPA